MDFCTIGRRIQQARLVAGMTQDELAQLLDMTPKYISNLECGAKAARLETFIAIANALKIDANTLLQDVLEAMPRAHGSLEAKVDALNPSDRDRLIRIIDAYIGDDNC